MTTILVTGSSRGIGRAIIEALRARGANVIGHASGPAGDAIPADLAEPPAAQLLWEEALERAEGQIDVLVNNAGIFAANPIDSSDIAFQTAAGLALRELASAATLCLLEPIDTVTVTVDDEHLGAVMTDIGTRRGQIVGSEPSDEAGRSVLVAAVPRLELLDYAIALRSLAHGTGSFRREPRGYEVLPERIARDHLTAAGRSD